MTDTIQPRPDPDFLVEMFALLEVPRLAELLAAGDLSGLSDEDLRNYCRCAAMWDGPPLRSHDGEDLREGAAFHFGHLLAVILSADGDEYFEVDGQPWLRTPYGERPVTEHTLAHFQRMFALTSDEGTARRFLALAPAWARAEGDQAAAHAWQWAFTDLAGR